MSFDTPSRFEVAEMLASLRDQSLAAGGRIPMPVAGGNDSVLMQFGLGTRRLTASEMLDDRWPPAPNLPLLRKVMDWVTEQAGKHYGSSEWDQTMWVNGGAECGTSYCVAGYVCHVSGADFIDGENVAYQGRVTGAGELARQLLGLSHSESLRMFRGNNRLPDVRAVAAEVAERAGEPL